MTTVADTAGNNRLAAQGFQPGVSGNPSGRPKQFAGILRERTEQGEELVAFALNVLRGKPIDGEKPSLKLRMQALEWCTDRGWGKAVAIVEHTGTIEHTRSVLSTLGEDDLQAIIAAGKEALIRQNQVIEGEVHELEAHDA